MRVLVACEFSGIVRDAFAARGHDAWSCDLLPTERPGNHIQGDVLDILDDGWDMMIAHPPCTHLATSGARYFHIKRNLQESALDFVIALMNAPIPRIAVENPVSIISSRIRQPDQVIQPNQFGEDASKATCLWLKNLPLLQPTKIIPGRSTEYNGKVVLRWGNQSPCGANSTPPSPDRWKIRSRTFPGIADAFAEQWGNTDMPMQTELGLFKAL